MGGCRCGGRRARFARRCGRNAERNGGAPIGGAETRCEVGDGKAVCRRSIPDSTRNNCEGCDRPTRQPPRSEEHTSELQSLMSISYAVFCLKQKSKALTTNP